MLVEQVEALKSIQETYVTMNEAFAHQNHKKLDANGNGKLDAQDFAMLRAKKKGIKNFKEFKEDLEQLDELSKKTLGSYITKASMNRGHAGIDVGASKQDSPEQVANLKQMKKRQAGIKTAVSKLTKEEIEDLDEKTMSPEDMKQREKIVKGMKKNEKGFEDKYGARAKSVMYATATKMATKD